jgi:hypothetical protein
LTKEDLRRASKSIDGIQLAEGVTKERFFARMEEYKLLTKEKKEVLWNQAPQSLQQFYAQVQPYTFDELDKLTNNLHHNLDTKSTSKLPPVLVWIVEDAIFGWNRASLNQTSKTIADASKKLDEMAFNFANNFFYFRQLEFFNPRNLTELQPFLPKKDEADSKAYFNDTFYSDWKEARESHKLSTFASSQSIKPSSLADRAKRYQKICNIFTSINIFNDSRFTLAEREILSCIMQDLDRKTNGYVETMRKFILSCHTSTSKSITNVFVTRRNLVLTATLLMMLGLNKAIKPSSLFHIHQAKDMQEFMEKQIYRIFGPHRRVAVLISREHKPPLNRNLNLKIVDVYKKNDLDSFLNLLMNKPH